ncbi:MAG TPA: class I adenylate-forming enzyme family protein [Pirellulales bacterium]|jgi:acyl-CoA synthetase (AMP-forming)/AMP-acid ligase II
MSLCTLFSDYASRWPTKTALWFHDKGWTAGEMNDAANRIAASLAAGGIQAGDRVALFMPNCIELFQCYWGIFKLGAIAVPMNYRYRTEEAQYALEHSQAKAIVAHEKLIAELAPLPLVKMGVLHCFQIGGEPKNPFVPFSDLLKSSAAAAVPIAEAADADPAAILYTSGSTANPKGVTHTYGGLGACGELQSATFDFISDDVHLIVTSACHIASFSGQLIPSLWSGGTCVLTHVPQPEEIVKAIETHGVTRTQMLPTGLEDLVEYLEAHPGANLKSWKSATVGGDVVALELQHRFHKLIGFDVTELYGLTEAVTTLTNPPFGEKRPGSIGQPTVQTSARIVDEDDRELPVGETGELVLRTPSMMRGYWNDTEATAATLRNGWLHTGDLARRDADGFYWFVGRKKEIIIRGGSNISPMEIEAVLDNHPAVHASCVVGKADAHFGQIVIAYVQLRDDVAEKPTLESLKQFVADRIAAYKVPERIHLVADLPLNASGKVDRKQMHAVVKTESSGQ